jgi:hypothetical protein
MWYATEVHARTITAWLLRQRPRGQHRAARRWQNPPAVPAGAAPNAERFIRTGRWGP